MHARGSTRGGGNFMGVFNREWSTVSGPGARRRESTVDTGQQRPHGGHEGPAVELHLADLVLGQGPAGVRGGGEGGKPDFQETNRERSK